VPDQVYVPQTWGEVLGSGKAFIAAATPVMAVLLGVLSAVVTAAKCPGMRRPEPVRVRSSRVGGRVRRR
jgi:hypothetical protein